MQINYGAPYALGEQTNQPQTPEYRNETSSGIQSSVFAEYYGPKVGGDDFDHDEKLNGIGTGITLTALDTFNTTLGVNFQKNSE